MKRFSGILYVECAACGKIVCRRATANARSQRFCSQECGRKYKRPQPCKGPSFRCGVCGETVYVKPSHVIPGKTYYCSRDHAYLAQPRNRKVPCKVCGTEFPQYKGKANIYCSLACRNADPDYLSHLADLNARQLRGRETKIERVGYEILGRIGRPFFRQHLLFEKFCVDAYLPDHHLVIQFDGDYWHGKPDRYSNPSPRQLARIRTDQGQDHYLAKCGMRVLRFWETDIHGRPEWVEESIRSAIHGI